MPAEEESVVDEEILFRSIDQEHITIENGQIVRLSSQAFADRTSKVSFDRAILRSAESVKFRPSDAVVRVLVRDIRRLPPITYNQKAYAVDAKPDPLETNPAHALVYAEGLEGEGFEKLKRALTKIARLELLPEIQE